MHGFFSLAGYPSVLSILDTPLPVRHAQEVADPGLFIYIHESLDLSS